MNCSVKFIVCSLSMIFWKQQVLYKKEKGVNLEKTEVINALRIKYQLNMLLNALKIAQSSYCYTNHMLNAPDKYQNLREDVKTEFAEGFHTMGTGGSIVP